MTVEKIVKLLLTAHIYNEHEELDENDLPPHIRKHYWNKEEKAVKRPLVVTEKDVKAIYDIEHPKNNIQGLPFLKIDEFGSRMYLTTPEIGVKWFIGRDTLDMIKANPVLAFFYEKYDSVDVSYEEAKKHNKPKEMDREWIDSLIHEVITDDESKEMMKLVHIKAPEEIIQPLSDLVLSDAQMRDLEKISKAIEYREYLSDIGLREIGKLLFVGPPGTGKTSTARAICEWLGIPFLEVKLSMITSQYLGETSKNIDKVFDLAKLLNPCILFIDEFDFVAKTRTSDEHAALKRAVNTLLKAIDEISLVVDGVVLIGATNHPQLLDFAAWRRFDEILYFPLPDAKIRESILFRVLSKVNGDFDLKEIAQKTKGYSGSDLRVLIREAILTNLLKDEKSLTQKDLLNAVTAFENRTSYLEFVE